MAWKAAQNPVDSARNLVGGVFDIATTAATKLLPKDLVDTLYSYEDDPNSMQYKINEYFKTPFKVPYFGNADMSFLSTKPRESYEKIGSQIEEDISNTYDKLSSPESAAKLIANNPLETLLNISGIGSLLKYPIKKTGLLDNEAGQMIDNITDQSPTSLISGVPQVLKNRKNRK